MSRQFMRQMQKKKGGAMPDMSGQMGNLMKVQEKIQEELGNKVVEGFAAGNMVKIEMTGRQELVSVKIDPSVVDPEDVGMLEDLILVAFKDAMEKSQQLGSEAMSALTGGLKIPGLF